MKAKDLRKGDFFRFTAYPYADNTAAYLAVEIYSNKVICIDPLVGERRECTHMDAEVIPLDVKLQVSPLLTLEDLAPGDIFRVDAGAHTRYVKLGGEDAGYVASIHIGNRVCINGSVKVEKISLSTP